MSDDIFNDEHDIVPSANQQLTQAKELITAGNHAQALPIVVQILKQDRENVPALWLYANLKKTDDPDKAIAALRTLLKVDPNHQKAQRLLLQLDPEDDDLFDTFDVEKPVKSASKAPVEDRIQINFNPTIDVQGSRTQMVAGGYGMPMQVQPQRNETAFIIGMLAGIFLGLFGIAYLFNGKIGAGIGYIVMSFFWWILAGVIVTVTLGFGAFIVIPLHIYLVYRNAKDGAAKPALMQPMGGGMTMG